LNYFLDTSALLLHYRDESGAERLQEIFEEAGAEFRVASPSLTEFFRRMAALEEPKEKTLRAWHTYRRMFREVVSVGEEVATAAVRLGESSSGRLPLTDSLIAACALVTRSRLLHADPHFERIPKNLLKQERLRD